MSVRLQELIHKYEVGTGYRFLTYVLGLFMLLAVGIGYDFVAYRNMSTPQGMDAAQVGRNLAEGRGFTTYFIRPLSIHLLKRREAGRHNVSPEPVTATVAGRSAAGGKQWARLDGSHPDLANAPMYPILLALAFKIMPAKHPQLTPGEPFRMYQPDLWVAAVNQILLVAMVILVFWLARRLFDEPVAWVSAGVVAGTELLWRYSLSGLSTVLAMFFFLALCAALALLDAASRRETSRTGTLILRAFLAGLMLGLAAMTRYSLLALLLPASIFLITLPHRRRGVCFLMLWLGCGLVVAPWLTRNYMLSGTLFGTAGFAIHQGTSMFSTVEVERLLAPEFGLLGVADYWLKLLVNGRELLQNDLLRLAGSWITPLFFAGVLLPFRNPTLGRTRWLVVGAVIMLGCAQALGRVSLEPRTDEPDAENLLIIAAPMVILFGASLMFSLLTQFTLPSVHYPLAGAVATLASLPLLLNLVLPTPSPIVYPPYYPPWIQAKSRWIEQRDWMAADIPWAVAWYGGRQSVWLPFRHGSRDNASEDFYALHALRPLRGLYLSAKTLQKMDTSVIVRWRESQDPDRDWTRFQGLVKDLGAKLPSEQSSALRDLYRLADLHWIRGGGEDWESFVVGVIINQEVPTGFPLKYAPDGLWPEIFLTENEQGG